MSSSREDRFCLLYDQSRPQIIAYALRRTKSREDAADIVAETFEIAWRRLDDVPTGAAGVLWLYVTARHVLANQVRRIHRQSDVTARLSEELRGAPLIVEAPDEHGLLLRACLDSLSSDERELLMLAGWEGLTAVEMGRVLGCSPTAARIRLHRARTRLAAQMAEQAGAPTTMKRSARARHVQDEPIEQIGTPREVLEQ
jgi:RNA polymerase sigma factor (sigma-70 family)